MSQHINSNLKVTRMWAALGLISLITFLASCVSVNHSNVQTSGNAISPQFDSVCSNAAKYSDKIEIHYAKGLRVDYRKDGIHVFISNPSIEGDRAEEIVIKDKQVGKRFICTTALQLGNFEVLGLEDHIVGINSLKNIFSSNILAQLANGTTAKVGKEGNFDVETVIASRPDYIFVSASKFGGYDALKDCNIPLIPHHGYKETNPLGQAEWIKLIGLLTGETRRANAVFDYIEHEYLALREKVERHCASLPKDSLPTVISGRQLRDGWYVMGGRSYMAQLFHDAGARYIMDYLTETGGVTLDFESVFARAVKADYWQTDGSFDTAFTLDDLLIEDARYGELKAFRNQKVLFCNLTMTPYRELAGVAPHLMLSDFVKAFHPELLPGYKPHFYDMIK